jgi:hypothetical protein
MDRLQLSNHTSGIGPSGDANFLILVDFLEHLYSSATSDGWKSIRAIDTFRFLLRHCPREPVPRLLQHRFATWFFNTIDGPFIDSHRRMVIAVIDWLYDSFSSEQFDDMDARHRIGEALTKFSATLSPDRDQGLPPPEPIVLHGQGHAWYRRSDSVTSFWSDSETSGQSRRIATTPDSVVRQKIALLMVGLRSPPGTVHARTGGEGPVDNYRMIQRSETGWSGSLDGDLHYTECEKALDHPF